MNLRRFSTFGVRPKAASAADLLGFTPTVELLNQLPQQEQPASAVVRGAHAKKKKKRVTALWAPRAGGEGALLAARQREKIDAVEARVDLTEDSGRLLIVLVGLPARQPSQWALARWPPTAPGATPLCSGLTSEPEAAEAPSLCGCLEERRPAALLCLPTSPDVASAIRRQARGKSIVAEKLERFLSWRGWRTQAFSAGARRRAALGAGSASFFAAKRDQPAERRLGSATAHHPGLPGQTPLVPGQLVHSRWAYGWPRALCDMGACGATARPGRSGRLRGVRPPRDGAQAGAREQVAKLVLEEALAFFDDGGEIAILDASNCTLARRRLQANTPHPAPRTPTP